MITVVGGAQQYYPPLISHPTIPVYLVRGTDIFFFVFEYGSHMKVEGWAPGQKEVLNLMMCYQNFETKLDCVKSNF